MIVFFDVLLVDEDPVLHQPYRDRREQLAQLITEIPGRASLAQCQEINFSHRGALERLTHALAHAIARRWEGCVLKPADEPYVNFHPCIPGDYRSEWIKLKKDYIPGLGDSAELAVVGAGYDVKEAVRLGLTHLPWTVFHIAALSNKDDVLRLGVKPKFVVLDSLNTSISKDDMEHLCQVGKFCAVDIGSFAKYDMLEILEGNPNVQKMDVVFTRPFVFEVKGSGFSQPPNYDQFVLRFPRLLKIHWHRDFRDTVSFDELQGLAQQAMNAPEDDILTEIAIWKERVKETHVNRWDYDLRSDDSEESKNESDSETTPSLPTSNYSPVNMRAARDHTFVRMDTMERLPSEQRLNNGEVISVLISSQPTSIALSATTSHSPPNVAVPRYKTFVRMDTQEMMPSEQRLCTGEVISLPLSSHSTSTTESAGTLHSSSASSLSHFSGTGSPNKILPPSGRKRSRPEAAEPDLSPPPLKNARKGKYIVSIKTGIEILPSPTTRRATLTEVTNSAAPPQKSRSESPETLHKLDKSSLILVRNLPPRATVRSTRNPITEPTPPFHSATKSECTSSITSSSSASNPTPTFPVRPKFAQSVTILSPCVAQMPYLTETLLPTHNATVVSISDLRTCPSTLYDTAQKDVVALVESYRDDATALFIKALLSVMSSDLTIAEIWDWRIAEKRRDREERSGRWFVGRVRREEGEWVIVWKNGDVTRAR